MTQDPTPRPAARYRTLIAIGAIVLLAVSAVVGASASRSGSSSSPQSDSPASGTSPTVDSTTTPGTPSAGGPGSTTTFGMIAPGRPLPSDEHCGTLVKDASDGDQETVPANIPFNHVRGGQQLPPDFFAPGSGDPREDREIAARVTGNFTGTTDQVLRWAACKWGIDERYVRAQAKVESSWRQTKRGDWTSDASRCAPGHELGADGRAGQCPESFGVLQVRYAYFPGAFPAAINSTAFNIDTAYAVWRACYEGYEWWLRDVQASGQAYAAGSVWGCIGRWYSGEWFDQAAQEYSACVQQVVAGRSPCR